MVIKMDFVLIVENTMRKMSLMKCSVSVRIPISNVEIVINGLGVFVSSPLWVQIMSTI